MLVSADDFRRLTTCEIDIVEFFKRPPLHGVSLDIERGRDYPREDCL